MVDEFPYRIVRHDGMVTWLYDVGLVAPALAAGASHQHGGAVFDGMAARLRATVLAIWTRHADADSFSALGLTAGLTWQQSAVLRLYSRYLQQVSFPHGMERAASVLSEYPRAARTLSELFIARFDPERARATDSELHTAAHDRRGRHLEADRLLRALLDLILVSSPKVEGVHLRFGQVARGGLCEPFDVAQLYYALSAHLGIDHVLSTVSALDDADRWDALAKSTLREDVYDAMRSSCRATVTWTAPDDPVTLMIEDWELTNRSRLSRARAMLTEIVNRGVYDVTTLSVATRQLRTMVSKTHDDDAHATN